MSYSSASAVSRRSEIDLIVERLLHVGVRRMCGTARERDRHIAPHALSLRRQRISAPWKAESTSPNEQPQAENREDTR